MNKLLSTILLVICYLNGFGQGSFLSENGLFSADYLKGCTGTTITVTPQLATGNYFFCFDGDAQDPGGQANQDCFTTQANQVNKLSYTYNTPGTYTIIGFRQLTNSAIFDSLTIVILDPILPALSFANCSGVIYFDLNSDEESFDFYTLDFGDGSPVNEYALNQFPITHNFPDNTTNYTINISARLDNTGFNNCNNTTTSFSIIPNDLIEEAAVINDLNLISVNSFSIDYEVNANQSYYIQLKEGVNGTYNNVEFLTQATSGTYTFNALDLNNIVYCVRIIYQSQCNSNTLLSNEACTILFEPSALQNGNLINWNADQFEESSVYKNGEIVYTGPAPFLDTNVLCGQADTYYVEVLDANGITITSFSSDINALFGNPTAGIEQISLNTISNDELIISWEAPAGLQPEKYVIYRKRKSNGEFFVLDSASTEEYTERGLDFNSRIFTYGISYTNNCGGSSDIINLASNILLTSATKDNTITFNWNSYTGYGSSLNEYVLNQYDDNMNLIASYNSQDTTYTLSTETSDIQKLTFQLEAHAINGAVSYSNKISYKIPSSFFVPSAFTPDGNGINEELIVLGKFIDQVELIIYNRWGNLIFKSTQLEVGWNGYLRNDEAPTGAYSYVVTVKDQYGETYTKSGIINLIR